MQEVSFKGCEDWALILGGSSGIGLATAKKLAAAGMNVCVVHRDRRGAMKRIEEDFAAIQETGVRFATFNVNALTDDGRASVLDVLEGKLEGQRVRLLLHSIALGNLKLFAPPKDAATEDPAAKLAKKLDIQADQLRAAAAELAAGDCPQLFELAAPPQPLSVDMENLARDEDLAQTIYNMGTSLLSWVQDLHSRSMFAADARVIGLTSEGNTTAWRAYGPVAAAKAALEAVARSIAVEFAPHGIRCNIVQPGVTDTPALRLIPGAARMKAQALCRNPLGRLTRPDDVANAVALLCTDEAAWINGALLRVDGGEHISG